MKKVIALACLSAVILNSGAVSGRQILYTDYITARESDETVYGISFLEAIDSAYAENEAETETDSFPEVFDLRDYGLIPQVKKQGEHGTCWAIAATDSLETQIINRGYEESPDLSEWHLAYFTYSGYKSFMPNSGPIFNSGGTNTIATAALSRWIGAVNENRLPYASTDEPDQSLKFESDYHVTDVYNVHPLASNHVIHSIDFIKELIYDKNSVAGTYYSRSQYYNPDTASHYCYDSDTGIDHAVVLIGWDDNYPKENFLAGKQPQNNGAWLAKNSWGESWGDNGFFWISYEDKSLCEAGCYFGEPADTYSTNYQYDESGWATSISADGYQKSLTGYMSNVFTAENDDPITAVSFYTTEDNADYEITVYTDVSVNSKKPSPVNGNASVTTSGTQKYTGYHTVKLDEPVKVKKGSSFSVVVKLTNKESPYVIPMEASSASVSSGFFSTRTYLFHQYADQEKDPSYISLDGKSWLTTTGKRYSYDYPKYMHFSSLLNNLRSVTLGNVCLKAFASHTDNDDPEPIVTEPVTTTAAPVVTEPVTTAVKPAVTESVTTTAKPAVTEPPVTNSPVMDEPEIFDINKDGRVSSADLLLMMKIFQGASPETYVTDVNGDGRTTIIDLILLKERLVNVDKFSVQ